MKKFLFTFFIFTSFGSIAQKNATVKEYNKSFTTYPFSNPDPVPDPSSIFYPYFRFDGFTNDPVKKEWKIVELENDFIKVLITPQIGGKIWTAIDKKNNKPFLYDNDAVKFRDIAMRGPWTSGGLEANFGIVGHTPGVATPVNYLTSTTDDGSAVCVISLLDLITLTRWNMEIILPKDKAYFITRFLWHNGTPVQQPYYTWMNLGQKVTDSLEYIFPGNHHIFHDGKAFDFPYDKERHKDISVYDQNNFGSYKSYHVTGTYSKYFGVLWQKENYGMIHFAERQDKIGKKIWIWGLSRQGMIWEKLLSDNAGQYTEIQSGRLYNQNAPESVTSPFKQFDFIPYNTDTWSEYWYPFQNTDGVANADLNGVINLTNSNGKTIIYFSPVSYVKDTMKVWDNKENLLFSFPVDVKPLQSIQHEITIKGDEAIAKITVAGSVLNLQDSTAKNLDRPVEPYPDFDWNSSYGLYVKGNYQSATRHYTEAEMNIRASLALNPSFVPALSEMAFLQYRKMKYDSAFQYARTALSVDTYDSKANYYYGLAALKLNKIYDAKDGLQVAAITPQYRSASFTELSKIALRHKDYKEAFEYAQKSLVNNTENVSALQLLYVCSAMEGDQIKREDFKNRILKLDPINHFIRFEEYWQNKNDETKASFTKLIRDELPVQTYLNLAIWYYDLGRFDRCKSVLDVCPQKNDEVLYWLAWLNKNDGNESQLLTDADNGDPSFVFPFREESLEVMKWAVEKSDNWKRRYYLSLLLSFHGQNENALHLLVKENAPQKFAPYFVLRSRLRDSADVKGIEADLTTAFNMNKADWRYAKYLSSFLISQDRAKEALQIITPYFKGDSKNYVVGLLYIRLLILNNDYIAAENVLKTINVLPNEGAKDAHKYYEQTKLMLAFGALKKKNYKIALQKVNEAKLWPESLGVGAPYPDMIDNSLENDLSELIGKIQQGEKLTDDITESFTKKIERLHSSKE